jgi:hypothetical protein
VPNRACSKANDLYVSLYGRCIDPVMILFTEARPPTYQQKKKVNKPIFIKANF